MVRSRSEYADHCGKHCISALFLGGQEVQDLAHGLYHEGFAHLLYTIVVFLLWKPWYSLETVESTYQQLCNILGFGLRTLAENIAVLLIKTLADEDQVILEKFINLVIQEVCENWGSGKPA